MAFCCINQHLNEPGSTWCVECESLVAGAQIGDCLVVSYIGSGSSSDVYLAEQPSLNHRKVVIKILHRSCNQRHVNNFKREAALLASLSHPYILPIFSYGLIYERQAESPTCLPYLVLPYAEQGSLAGSFKRENRRPWALERVVSLAMEVAEALDYAHLRGVLHRDVKPANLLQMGSHVLLSDFSVASLIDSEISHLNLGWAGSPAYMAPEVWGLRPGRYSDQYSLAVTCFFLLAGDYPLRKNSEGKTRSWQQLHCYVAPSPLGDFRPDLPLPVNTVLQKALAKDPHQRYPTVQAFASDLLSASQDATKLLIKSLRLDLADTAQLPAGPSNVQERRENQHAGVSLADAPATDRIAFPATPPLEEALEKVEGKELPDIHTETLNVTRRSNKWTRYAFLLNLLVCLVLAAEYSWQARDVKSGAELFLAVCPALLAGPLLARLFQRIRLATFSWSVFWGVFFGITNALLSALICLGWSALVFAMPFFGNSGLSTFFNGASALMPGIELTLLALWMSVIGGALMGIFSVREGAVVHQGSQN